MPEQPKIQFTPAQAAAISVRGGSLLVSAAAGLPTLIAERRCA